MNLNLGEMAEGAFMEQFNIELKKVLANIADPNTDPKKARKITLTAILKADENRDIVNFEVQCKATLVPAKPIATKIIIDRDKDGSIVGAELKSGVKGQLFIDDDGQIRDDTGKVINFKK
ncbi:MAG: hypothetical protein PWQ82_1166 [Thermosediminibacterales bacterium]|nr:hypothetical protein [Thermosediminibacterales bacterium]